jgi:hypothetical protein
MRLLTQWEKGIIVRAGLLRSVNGILHDTARDFRIVDQVDAFRNTIRDLVSCATDLRIKMTALIDQSGLRLEDISDELGRAFSAILQELAAAFPPPSHAPGHQQRQKMVGLLFDKAEQAIIDIVRKYGMPEERLLDFQESVARVKPIITTLVIIIGMHSIWITFDLCKISSAHR